jgi:hypothetical protein
MKPDTSQHSRWTWLQMTQGPQCEGTKLQGPEQKMLKRARQGALSKPWRRRWQGPTCRRGQVNNWPRSVGERNRTEPDWPVSGPVRDALWPRCFSINCLRLRWPTHGSNHSTNTIHQKTAAARWGWELDELVARINVNGGKEARGGLQAAGLGVFPSFITAIFIDDVLRSLHHPYVLQSL